MELQIADVERALEKVGAGGTEGNLLTLQAYIEHINAVLGHADEYVRLVPVDLRVTLLGIKVDQPTSEEAFNELHLTDLFIGEGLSATVALGRIRRDDLPPKEDLLAQAERFL